MSGVASSTPVDEGNVAAQKKERLKDGNSDGLAFFGNFYWDRFY